MKDEETGSQPDMKKSFAGPSSYLNSNRITMGRTRASSAAAVRHDNSRFSVMRSVSRGIKYLRERA